MIPLPEQAKAYDWENNFYLTCDITRISKILAHYELYKMVQDVPGAIIECGVFKGASLGRFAAFREIFSSPYSKKIIGFDSFGPFPETNHAPDFKKRDHFIKEAGEESIGIDQMKEVLKTKGCDRNVELVAGNICQTVPDYVKNHPELKISLLNLDTDIYEPAMTILEYFYPRMTKGGIIILDDYGVFPGETTAVDTYFKDKKATIRKFPFCMTPCYFICD
ncbi:MAG: dTDP-6-deoxy-L-hexose 3-O-methyltransferase [Elusimicrobia bacterium RIFOXYB2_FULL_49_7]|nr:MAG: dTDP-6-deoxy-L-hexose 3-O-methyltransferase [Elusimicrobia bacterium RIFOXYB2_FULL_49_7]